MGKEIEEGEMEAILDNKGEKPKGMHWRIYEAFCRQGELGFGEEVAIIVEKTSQEILEEAAEEDTEYSARSGYPGFVDPAWRWFI